MTDEQRADEYVRLFNHYDAKGVNWRHNAPLDAKVDPKVDRVRIGGIWLARTTTGGWGWSR